MRVRERAGSRRPRGGLSDVRAGRRRREGRLLPDQGAARSGHEVVLMEKDGARARADRRRARLDRARPGRLRGQAPGRGRANRADIVVAVTGDDEDNLVICQMAKTTSTCRARSRASTTPRTRTCSATSASTRSSAPRAWPWLDRAGHPGPRAAAPGALNGELEIIEAQLQADSPASAGARRARDPGGLLAVRARPRRRRDAAPTRYDPARGRQGHRHRQADCEPRSTRSSSARARAWCADAKASW